MSFYFCKGQTESRWKTTSSRSLERFANPAIGDQLLRIADNLNDAGIPVFPDERQNRIAELVATHGKVHMPQLVKLFDVTEVTLRKDLNTLEQRGLLKRTHGGAVSIRPPLEQEVVTRTARHATAKAEIAAACVELVNHGEAIFLDCGTTVHEIAKHLVGSSKRVMVLTSGACSCRNDCGRFLD